MKFWDPEHIECLVLRTYRVVQTTQQYCKTEEMIWGLAYPLIGFTIHKTV